MKEVTIGTLEVASRQPRRFESSEVQLLAVFAAQVAPALETPGLAAQREAQVRSFRALHDLAVAASGVLHLGALARLTVGHARAMLVVDGVILCGHGPMSDVPFTTGPPETVNETESPTYGPSVSTKGWSAGRTDCSGDYLVRASETPEHVDEQD